MIIQKKSDYNSSPEFFLLKEESVPRQKQFGIDSLNLICDVDINLWPEVLNIRLRYHLITNAYIYLFKKNL